MASKKHNVTFLTWLLFLFGESFVVGHGLIEKHSSPTDLVNLSQ